MTPKAIREWLREGRLRGKRFGRKWVTTAEWLEAFATTNHAPQEPSEEECTRRAEAAKQRIQDKFGR